MTASPSGVAIAERARSLALRMLSGAGSSVMHAYRHGVCLTSMTHGIHDGRLLVACQPEMAWLREESIEVRLDLTLTSQRADIAITASSAHLLGTLTWLSIEATADLLAEGLPGALDAPLAMPGGRLGVVDTTRAVLHDFTGSTAIDLTGGLEPAAAFVDEWTAYDLVAALTQEQLRDICWAVMTESLPGHVETREVAVMCAHAIGLAFIVDVDRLGVTLMLTGSNEIITVFAAFATPASTAADLRWSVSRLALDSAPTRY